MWHCRWVSPASPSAVVASLRCQQYLLGAPGHISMDSDCCRQCLKSGVRQCHNCCVMCRLTSELLSMLVAVLPLEEAQRTSKAKQAQQQSPSQGAAQAAGAAAAARSVRQPASGRFPEHRDAPPW